MQAHGIWGSGLAQRWFCGYDGAEVWNNDHWFSVILFKGRRIRVLLLAVLCGTGFDYITGTAGDGKEESRLERGQVEIFSVLASLFFENAWFWHCNEFSAQPHTLFVPE